MRMSVPVVVGCLGVAACGGIAPPGVDDPGSKGADAATESVLVSLERRQVFGTCFQKGQMLTAEIRGAADGTRSLSGEVFRGCPVRLSR